MRKTIILCLITITLMGFGMTLAQSGDKASKLTGINKYLELEKKVDNIHNNMNNYDNYISDKIIDASNSAINNSIAAESKLITWFGTLIAVMAIVVAIYGLYLQKKISDTLDKNKVILDKSESNTQQVISILGQIQDLKEDIESNPEKIYRQIESEETKFIFSRLDEHPYDIVNSFEKLATREIKNERYYDILLKGWNTMTEDQLKFNYMVLVFQHFPHNLIHDLTNTNLWNYFLQESTECIENNNFYPDELEFASIEFTRIFSLDPTLYKKRWEEIIKVLHETDKIILGNSLYLKILEALNEQVLKDSFKDLISP